MFPMITRETGGSTFHKGQEAQAKSRTQLSGRRRSRRRKEERFDSLRGPWLLSILMSLPKATCRSSAARSGGAEEP